MVFIILTDTRGRYRNPDASISQLWNFYVNSYVKYFHSKHTNTSEKFLSAISQLGKPEVTN